MNTYGELKEHLLNVMEYADDKPCKGNPSISKVKLWDFFMADCIDHSDEDKPSEITVTNILKEFPKYLYE